MRGSRRVRPGVAAKKLKAPTSLSVGDQVFFRDLWGRDKTPIEMFISFFDIKTEDAEDGEPSYVQFNLREMQLELLNRVRGSWAARKAALFLVLKGRRYGMSIFLIMFALERVLRVPGYEVCLVAQDDVMAEYHFGKLRELFDQIPEGVLEFLGVEVLKGTTHEIRLRHGNGRISHFWVAPAKRRALGRGQGVNMLILTEFPQWPASAKTDLSGLLRACKKMKGNAVFFESTAQGRESFWRRCKNAREGKSNYQFFFVPSFKHPLSFREFRDEAHMDDFETGIGVDAVFGKMEEMVLYRRLLEEEKWPRERALRHLYHRRSVIVDDCESLLSVYHREEPTTPEEAFEGTGRPVFSHAFIGAWEPFAQAKEESAWKMNLRHARAEKREYVEPSFDTNARNQLLWTVFKYPEVGKTYAWGSDVASGYEVYRDGKSVADHTTVTIAEVVTGEVVARLCDYVDPKDLAWELMKATFWYGGATGFVERNMDGGTVISHLEEMEIGDVHGADVMLGSYRIVKTDSGKGKQWEPGFKTTTASKTKWVDAIKVFLRSKTQVLPTEKSLCPFDAKTLDEMGSFVRLIPEGGVKRIGGAVPMGADEGWDDLVVSMGLMLLAREEVMQDMKSYSRVPDREREDMKMLRKLWGEGKRAVDNVLGSMF